MSFSENPFKHVTFGVRDDGRVHLECSSCGGGWKRTWDPAEVTAAEMLEEQRHHVRISHARSEEDFRGWS